MIVVLVLMLLISISNFNVIFVKEDVGLAYVIEKYNIRGVLVMII